MKKILLLSASCALLFAACKKDKEEPQPTRSELLQAGKWRVTGETEKGIVNGQPYSKDNYANMDLCYKDDYLVFGNNGAVVSYQGTLYCNSLDTVGRTTIYALINNDSQIVFDEEDTLNIKELSATTMVLGQTYKEDGDSTDFIVSFKNIK